MSWSWPGFFSSLCLLFGRWLTALADFWGEDMSMTFAMMHNRKIDRDDQRDVAEDVLATIHQLPTKE
jgi:hypothetical protein